MHLSSPRIRQLAKILLVVALLTALASGTLLVRALLPQEVQTAAAQGEAPDSFSSGSNGSDGAFTITTPGTYIFDHVNFPFDPDGDYVYHFTTITIGTGVTLILRSPNMTAPVYWLATGDVQIDGIIDLNGQNGQNTLDIIDCGARFSALPGSGGFGGGTGKCANSTVTSGQYGKGPGGGLSYSGWTTGGGGHQFQGGGSSSLKGPAYGNNFLVPLIGGSGGGGGGSDSSNASGGGGGGGGAILVASSGSITVNGTLRANGGVGGASIGSAFGGGGGSGGNIHLIATEVNVIGSLLGQGGNGGSGAGNGSAGRIRLEAFTFSLAGSTINPGAIYGTPFNVYLPENPPPSAKVVAVDGIPVPGIPTGSYSTPDVTINMPSNSVFTIEAHYIPLGTTVELHLVSEDGADQIVTSTPLAGTFESSTATVTATVPTGFSRFFVISDWTP